MRCTLDAIFKVGFGAELNCLEGSNKEGLAFMKAFDDSQALLLWRFIDPFWKLKKLLSIGSEATLKNNIRLVDEFVDKLIREKRRMFEERRDCVSDSISKNSFLALQDSNNGFFFFLFNLLLL